MTKVTVEFQGDMEQTDEGTLLLEMEQLLRLRWPDYDVRVLKARQADDSLLRIKRTA